MAPTRLPLSRQVVQECELPLSAAAPGRLFKLRRGDRVALFPPLAHYDAEIFADPAHFDPTRFLPRGALPLPRGPVCTEA
jgi:cytochrome P450